MIHRLEIGDMCRNSENKHEFLVDMNIAGGHAGHWPRHDFSHSLLLYKYERMYLASATDNGRKLSSKKKTSRLHFRATHDESALVRSLSVRENVVKNYTTFTSNYTKINHILTSWTLQNNIFQSYKRPSSLGVFFHIFTSTWPILFEFPEITG